MHITDAIILKKEAVGEADLLVTALTDRFARLRFLAQGARKSSAKLKGHLEPFSLTRVMFVAGRTQYRLIGAELKNFFPTIRQDFNRLRIAAEAAATLDRTLFEDAADEHAAFFAIAREAFLFLDNPAHSPEECRKSFLWFQLGFLHACGLLPEAIDGRATSAALIPCADFVAGCDAAAERTFTASLRSLFRAYIAR